MDVMALTLPFTLTLDWTMPIPTNHHSLTAAILRKSEEGLLEKLTLDKDRPDVYFYEVRAARHVISIGITQEAYEESFAQIRVRLLSQLLQAIS